MYLKNYILKNRKVFHQLCKSHKVSLLYAFGSSITKAFNANDSDIDLLVDIDEADPLKKGELLLSLWDALEKFFGRRVDLLTPQSISNQYLKESIDSTKELIYEGSTKKISV